MRRTTLIPTLLAFFCAWPAPRLDADGRAKEDITALQQRVAKMAADFEARRMAGLPPAEGPVGVRGSVVQMLREDKKPNGIGLVPDYIGQGFPVYETKETKVFYSDRSKAKWSDLRLGQQVTIGGRIVELSASVLKVEADAIFIEKAAREIFDPKDPAAIAAQVDFAKEHLLLFRWQGWGGFAMDRLTFTGEDGKEGRTVVFHFIRPRRLAGMAKVPEITNTRLYVIANGAHVMGGPPGGRGSRSPVPRN